MAASASGAARARSAVAVAAPALPATDGFGPGSEGPADGPSTAAREAPFAAGEESGPDGVAEGSLPGGAWTVPVASCQDWAVKKISAGPKGCGLPGERKKRARAPSTSWVCRARAAGTSPGVAVASRPGVAARGQAGHAVALGPNEAA